MASDDKKSRIPGLGLVCDMCKALVDEQTYDVRGNPTLWIGFLLAIPIPVLTYAAGATTWLKLASLPAPVIWAVIMGAAGRVGILAQQERDQLEQEAAVAADEAREAEESLDEAVKQSQKLERRHQEVVSELKLAQAVQRTLLPKPIHRKNIEVVARSIPTSYVGGDYVRSTIVKKRWLYLVMFDVSGHGVSAALVVARLHGLIRRMTYTEKRPTIILERLNVSAQRLLKHTYFFMTGVVARLDLKTGELEYATAGHPSQVLLRENGQLELLRTRNRLIGMDDDIFDSQAPSKRVQLEPGDSIVLFTDGLFEVLEDGKGEVLGEDGLRERLAQLGSLAPQLLIGEVLQELSEFQGSSEFEDDVTILAARWLGPTLLGSA
jgi:sigma-B regulation protein RsbU (phosphoserine phosphatase)